MYLSLLEGLQSFKWNMQGNVNDIGVQVKEPNSDINLSMASPIDIQKMIVKRTIIVLLRFLSHYLFLLFGISLYK